MRTFEPAAVVAAVIGTAGLVLGCSQPAQIEPVDIQPIAVAGPPAGWDMSTRLMNSRSASTATLSGPGSGAVAVFGGIAASMYYDAANDQPFTGTIVLRADSLSSDDPALVERPPRSRATRAAPATCPMRPGT